MTALAEQFQRNGLHPRDVEFDIAIAKYINSGGEISGALRRLELAAGRMLGEGQCNGARQRQSAVAQPRLPVEGERGHLTNADAGHLADVSPPSPHRDGGGQVERVRRDHPMVAAPVREPTPAFRKASVAASKMLAITVMDTLKIDGLAVGDWSVARARIEAKRKTREGFILREATRVVANASSQSLLRDVVKTDEMQRIIQRAAEFADAQ